MMMLGIGRHASTDRLPRHRHGEGYVALVLAGGYEEAGECGRFFAGPGSVVVHARYAAHRDSFGPKGATVLNLPAMDLPEGHGRIGDPDAVMRLAECDLAAAIALIEEDSRPSERACDDWPDLLARALRTDPGLAIAGWADCHGIDPASVSRGFARVYGTSPKRYRLEARSRRAALGLARWRGGLADYAVLHGFSDQAHLTRSLVATTGCTPGRLRRELSVKSVQSGCPHRR